jgi:hypothetical protein
MCMMLVGLMQGSVSTRRALVLLCLIALCGGLAASWSWIVDFGLAPIVLSIAWCVAVSGLGICMIKSNLRKRRQ